MIGQPGNIVHDGDKVLLVFGIAKDSEYEYYNRMIGINLDTEEIDHVNGHSFTREFNNLTTRQKAVLSKYFSAYAAMSQGTIAISGKARSGKDTFAKALTEFMEDSVIQSLGKPIYDARDAIHGKPKQGKKREQLIKLGQTLRKFVDQDVWIKAWLRICIDEYMSNGVETFIVPDVRQPNEFTFFKSLGATTVKITVDEEARLQKIKELDGASDINDELLKDETESHLESFETEFVFENDYTQLTLLSKVGELVGHINSKEIVD